ncbi:hypothetical protein NDU88_004035 [Pleurodeles waltl]|uniref:Uncharacterized protein n=1 Tax=Pleurodeles waltl TaxID=8319 RepID=A0AAV7REM0_PLEWA|nr:hypothetical protein NDU88_004035 [Pleurodeles waltl]
MATPLKDITMKLQNIQAPSIIESDAALNEPVRESPVSNPKPEHVPSKYTGMKVNDPSIGGRPINFR